MVTKHGYPNQQSSQRTKRTRTSSGYTDTGFRKSSMSSALYVRGSKANRTSFGALMRANTPLKYSIGSVSSGVLHNTAYTTPMTQSIVTGSGDGNRIGDEIFLKFLKIRMTINSGSASGAYTHRTIIGFSNVQNNTGASTTAGIYSAAVHAGTAAFIVDGIINPKNFTAIYDETFDIPSEIPATNNVHSVERVLPLERKFQYQTAGSVYGKLNNLYFIHLSTVIGGTTATSVTGQYDLSWALGFVDN